MSLLINNIVSKDINSMKRRDPIYIIPPNPNQTSIKLLVGLGGMILCRTYGFTIP